MFATLVAMLLAFSSRHTPNQPGRISVSRDTADLRFAGHWTGTIKTPDGASNAFALRIAHDSVWNVTTEVALNRQPVPSRSTGFATSGDRATWSVSLLGATCTASGTLGGASLRGDIVCGEARLEFDLRRSAD